MNQDRFNRELNFSCQNNGEQSRFPDCLPSHLTLDKYKPKGRAYINPQVLNCEYIKKSLYEGSLPGVKKIHVNPNFRGNEYSNALRIKNTQIPIRAECHLSLNSAQGQGPGPSAISTLHQEGSGVEVASLAHQNKVGKNVSDNMIKQSTSQFKSVNNISLKSGYKYNKSMYVWSKGNHKHNDVTDATTEISNVNNSMQTNKGTKSSNEKSKNYVFSANASKYTPVKKELKIVNSTGKTSTCDKKSPPLYLSKTKIINKSNAKLVNNVYPQVGLNFKQVKSHPVIKKNLNSSKFVYNKNKKSPTVKVASSVKNKYKYCKTSRNLKISNYKIDKRKKLPESSKKLDSVIEMHDIRKLFPENSHNKVKSSLGYLHPRFYYCGSLLHKNIHSWRKDETSENITQGKANHYCNKRVVKIGGILYKSTANKLTIANKKDQSTDPKKLLAKATKVKRNHIVYVRGEKFLLDKNGKTLRRKSGSLDKDKSCSTTIKRIDIGGVTYVQKSRNVLVGTNVHQARNLVNQAKHKSIAVLSNLHKKSKMPCMIFHKFGRCIRHNKGLCMYKHDPKNVAICKKFLKGNCCDKNCLLSHEVIQEKMATCRFFLNGFCNRENCPFLHVKLNKNVAICQDFLQGFCALGKNCSKRHFYQCPQHEKFGRCSAGIKCPYPHSAKTTESKENSSPESSQPKKECEPLQYYVKPLHLLTVQKQGNVKRSLLKLRNKQNRNELLKAKKKKAKSNQFSPSTNQISDTVECVPKRIKLDKLPCFIPLKSSQ